MSSEALKLGIALDFDQKSLDFLNIIFKKVNSYQNQFEHINQRVKDQTKGLQEVSNAVKKIEQNAGKLLSVQESINTKGKTLTKVYEEANGSIIKIKTNAYFGQTGHRIRFKLDRYSGSKWTMIPDQTGQVGAKRRIKKLA